MVSASSRAAIFVALLAVVKGLGPLELEYDRTSRPFGHTGAVPVSARAVDPQYQLKRFVNASTYTLDLRPVFQTDPIYTEIYTAPGNVIIDVVCVQASNYIQMHAHPSMVINSIKVETATGVGIFASHDFEPANHYLNVRLSQTMTVGATYKITIDFKANIWTNKLDGLYYAKYNEIDETTGLPVVKELVSTQFEAIGAREVFPCFDQPDYKANFRITLRHKQSYNAFSNGKLKTSTPDGQGWAATVFEETVKMPTYLIALIVSEHECILSEKGTVGGFEHMNIDVGICGRKEAVRPVASGGRNGAKKSADWSSRILNRIGKAFHYDYQNSPVKDNSKMHSVGIPENYFGAGAMENWGLNTYRESYLMFFDDDSTQANKQTVLNILSHELAHQWFGNLVTCNWWQQIWLNEGFATIVSYDAMKREFSKDGEDNFADMLDYMFYDANQGALMNDIDANMPVINKAQKVDEVDNVFGWPTYDKGGSLLRMMMGFMTEPEFVNGVSAYLLRHQYDSVHQVQFFDAMQPFAKNLPAGKNLTEVMETYTLKPGYPLIRVRRRITPGDTLLISQEIYRNRTAPPPAHAGQYPNELWEVPLRLVTDKDVPAGQTAHPVFGTAGQQPNLWLNKNVVQIQYNNAPKDWSWVIVNPNGAGYFRVLYDDAIVDAIAAQLLADPTKIPHLTRAHLIDDYFSFVTYGQHMDGLRMVRRLINYIDTHGETSRTVWSTIFYNLNKYLSVLKFRSVTADWMTLQDIMIPKIEKSLTVLNCDAAANKAGSVAILCTQLRDWQAALDQDGPEDFRRRLAVKAYFAGDANSDLTPDQRQVYYCPAVRGEPISADAEAVFAEMSTRFEADDLHIQTVPKLEFTRLLNGLACVEDLTILRNIVERTRSTVPADARYRLYRVALLQRIGTRSVHSRTALWGMIVSDLESFVKSFGQTETRNVLTSMVGTMSEEKDVTDITAFNNANRVILGGDISTAAIQSNIVWYEKYGHQLRNAWNPAMP